MYLSTANLDAEAISFLTTPIPHAISLEPNVLITGGSKIQRWSSLIGIVTAIVGNILISFALNIQRYAHLRLNEEEIRRKERLRAISKSVGGYGTLGMNSNRIVEEEEYEGNEEEPLRRSFYSQDSQSSICTDDDHGYQQSTYLQSPCWWGGIFLMAVGEFGNFLAYGFAPASIVSPLGVVALISNCVIAPIILKEPFRLRDFWGVVVAVAGAVTVVLSAKQEEKKFGPHEIWGAITTTEFEVYMGVTVLLIGALMWASPIYGRKTILVDLGLVGLFGGYTALSTKGLSSMLSSTFWRALTTPVTYVLLLVLGVTIIMQVRYINRALQRFDSTQVIPVQFVIFTLSVIIGSAILYRDFEKVTRENAVKFIGGCILTFFGVWLITSGRPPHDEDEDSSMVESQGEEERIRLATQDTVGDEVSYHNESRKRSSLQSKLRPCLVPTVDGSVDEDVVHDSRRSSHVSFAISTSRPETPQRTSSRHTSVRLHTSGSSDERPTSQGSPLLSNPWLNSFENIPPRHPGMQTSISSPVLPSEALSPSPSKPPITRNNTQSHLHNAQSQQNNTSPPQTELTLTPASYSIARMLPGTLISPLSGGLSVVVADSLRRGVDSPRGKSYRRSQPDLRRSKSVAQRLIQASEGTFDHEAIDAPLKGVEALQDGEERESFNRSIKIRARSLSITLGGFLRGKPKDERENGDEEAGPSGS